MRRRIKLILSRIELFPSPERVESPPQGGDFLYGERDYLYIMNYSEFLTTLAEAKPPASANNYLKVLWYEKKGQWEQSHNIAQDIHNGIGSRLHGYLHRREGDNSNARYWYNQAGLPFPKETMDEEWERMVNEFLD